jgi:acyl dehydratase
MVRSAFKVAEVRMTVNYGLNRVRFPAPVPVGSRLRGHFKLITYESIAGGAQVAVEVTTEREGHSKPVCVAQSVARHYV